MAQSRDPMAFAIILLLSSSTHSAYTGEFADGVPHGQGVATSAGGGRYEGAFAEGAPHGQGVYTGP